MDHARLIVGAMSGTSADGVDAALVRVTGRGTKMSASLVAHRHEPYTSSLRSAIFRIRGGSEPIPLNALAQLAREISLAYAQATRQVLAAAAMEATNVLAIAAHGQTLFHDPPNTIQWLDPALLAREIGCQVVSDFRRADCAAGGQGAPLVPFADYVLFRHEHKSRVLLNLGGIANITLVPARAGIEQVIAFDTGPGNCISDWLMRSADPAGRGYDADGAIASRGSPVEELLHRAIADDYFVTPPPKSTDVPAMVNLVQAARAAVASRDHRLEDLLATACHLTANTIADAVRCWCNPMPDELIVSGGGVRNATIISLIQQQLGSVPLIPIDTLGIPSEAKEAVAFALLGAATLDGEPSNVPAATGAKGRVVLGSITPRP